MATCQNIEDVELLKSHLNAAINESNRVEIARLLDKLVKFDVDPETLPIEESVNVIMGRIGRAYNWETITGEEIVQLSRPLEGIMKGTWREHMIRGVYFWGLMETGQREKAIGLWEKSEKQVHSLLDSPSSLSNHLDLPNEERAFRSATSHASIYFAIGFVSSKNSDDRRQGVELAKKHHHYLVETFKEVVKSSQLANPIAQAKITQLLPHESLSVYCLVESGLTMDKSTNPFLKDQPETTIRFDLVGNTGLEECGLRNANEEYNRVALGDYDNDGYADVLVPGNGMWRNIEGSGRFTRVDDKFGLDIKGICGAFVDVNNDGQVDVIVAGPDKVGVSLQTKKRIFRPVIRPSNRTVKNPGGIGLFDGDGDGLIDLYVSGYENPNGTGGLPDVVLRNKGDGTFENITEAWGFNGEDIEQCGKGVSPGDYDNDGRSDIYVSNYRLDRNTLWRNISEEDRPALIQCADSPWFGDDKRPEIQVGLDRGGEGLQTIFRGTTYWGHTSRAVWGDLNGDGTLDNVAKFKYFTTFFSKPR